MENPEWAARAKAIMKKLGLTQEDLRETLGVETRGAVGHYFNGRRKLTVGQADNLAAKLQTNMDALFGSQKAATTAVNEPPSSYSDPRIKEIADLLATLPSDEQDEHMEWLRFKARRKTKR